jgi:hypothetical protein
MVVLMVVSYASYSGCVLVTVRLTRSLAGRHRLVFEPQIPQRLSLEIPKQSILHVPINPQIFIHC